MAARSLTGDEDAADDIVQETLVVCCDLAGAPPFEYMRDIFAKIAAGWPQSRIAELLPAAWLDPRRQQQDAQTF